MKPHRPSAAHVAIALLALVAAVSAQPTGPGSNPTRSLWDIIAGTGDLSTLKGLLEFASTAPGSTVNFKGVLSNATSPITVFGPTNAAFSDLLGKLGPAAALLTRNVTAVTQILLVHALGSLRDTSDFANDTKFKTLLPGVDLTTLRRSSGAIDVVAPGSTARIVVPNVSGGGNQVLHIVDAVLLPVPGLVPQSPPPASRSLYSIISATPELSTLKTLVDIASAGPVNFRAVLSNTSTPLTVFAPTNSAFASLLDAIGPNTTNLLLKNVSAITDILLTHALGSAVYSRDLLDNATFTSLLGVNLTVSRNRFFTTIESPGANATITTPNVVGGAAVAHIVDNVLLPVDLDLPPTLYEIVSTSEDFTVLAGVIDLVSAAGDIDFVTILSNRSANLTVFAPTDEAFGALYDELGPSADAVFSNVTTLTGILLEHVLPRAVNSSQLTNGTSWATALGTFLNVTKTGEVTNIISTGSTAQVILPDVRGGVPIAHVINKVLLPTALPPSNTSASLYQIVSASKDLTYLKTLIDIASVGPVNFKRILSNTSSNITVFAPLDSAFLELSAKLGPDTVQALLKNVTAVTQILLTHVVGYVVNGSKLQDGLVLPSLQGASLTIGDDDGVKTVASPGAKGNVVLTNVRGGVSVAHVITAVLLPDPLPSPAPKPPAPAPKQLSPPTPEVQRSPPPAAKPPTPALSTPPAPVSAPPAPATKPPSPSVTTLYSIIATSPQFATLKTLVDLASSGPVNFRRILSDPTAQITVFAPTNEAFNDLLGQLGPQAAALASNATAVSGILLTHVVPGVYVKQDLERGCTLTSQAGVSLYIRLTSGDVRVVSPGATAVVEVFNVFGGDSVAHQIDAVLLPTKL